MENFTLWHFLYDGKAKTLAFYATVVNVQRIDRGTDAMVAKMLDDAGLGRVDGNRWSLTHFATDYLSDDLESEEWQDVWMDTCDIRLRTNRNVWYRPPPAPGFVETYAWDDTWSGEDDLVPETCTVIADFRRSRDLETALSVFNRLAQAASAEQFAGDVHKRVRRLSKDMAVDLWQQAEQLPGRSNAGTFTADPCEGYRQLHISMPADRQFFKAGAKPAITVEAVCHALGGTTHWRDRVGN